MDSHKRTHALIICLAGVSLAFSAITLVLVRRSFSDAPGVAAAAKIYQPTIDAHRFRLIDDLGRVRGVFGFADDRTSPLLVLSGETGKRRLLMMCKSDVLGVFLQNNNDIGRAMLGLDADENPILTMSDEKGTVRTLLSCLGSGEQSLSLYANRPDDMPIAMIGASEDGEPLLQLCNEQGNFAWQVGGKQGE